ncbi:MAG: hypothetical protein COB36_12350 [Alphaproteobacteria bacterium]|nr:MAG: hypothetical protein COB36_12350 [Alphaproteobacteria bacterium]
MIGTEKEREAVKHTWRPIAFALTVFWSLVGALYGSGLLSLPATVAAVTSVERSLSRVQHSIREVEVRFAGSNIGQLTTNVKRNTKSLDTTQKDVGEIKDTVNKLRTDTAVTKTKTENIESILERILDKLERD